MRRLLLTAALVGAAAVGGVGLWHVAVLDRAMLNEQVAAESNAKTADGHQEKTRPNGEAKHAHAEETAASEADRKEEEAQGAEHHEVVELSPAQIADFGIKLAVAESGSIAKDLERPAEVKFNGDRVVHVVPRVEGVAASVAFSQGQSVTQDAVMAVIDSRELAELKAAYLAALERRNLAHETFDRERGLWEKKISSEKDYLEAKTALAEADITVRASGHGRRK